MEGRKIRLTSTNALPLIPTSLIGVIYLLGIAGYILQSYALMRLFQKANVAYPWLAWIPVAYYWPFLWTIKKSAWNVLWYLVPIANIVFAIIWLVKFLRAYGQSGWMILINLIPYIGSLIFLIYLMVIAFSSKVNYVLDES